MGSEVIATCQCGVNASILIGGGMETHETICYFPCLCERCHAVVQVNLLDKRKRCPQCKTTKVIPYDDPRLSMNLVKTPKSSLFTGAVGEWNAKEILGRDLSLPEKNYRCPQCGQMTLCFTDGDMCWD